MAPSQDIHIRVHRREDKLNLVSHLFTFVSQIESGTRTRSRALHMFDLTTVLVVVLP